MKKKTTRILCITVMVIMLLSTMGVGAFAAVDQGITAQGNDSDAVETTEAISAEDTVEPEEAVVEESAAEEADFAVAEGAEYNYHPVSGVTTLPGHQRIMVSWPAYEDTSVIEVVEGSEETATEDEYYQVKETLVGYILVRNDKIYKANIGKDEEEFEDLSVGDGIYMYNGALHNGGAFKYKVIAKTSLSVEKIEAPEEGIEPVAVTEPGQLHTESEAIAEAVPSKATTCVRTSSVKLQLKTKKVLTSHDNKRVTRTFNSGKTIYTCGFGIGKHMFIYGDNMYYLNRISTKNTKSITTKTPYSKEVAEYFVNSRGNGSKTGKLVWVSVYTQHIYIFTGSAKNWKMKYCWKVSTGKSKTPTIRTIDPQGKNLDSGRMIGKSKTISKKLRSRHGIPYWNCFSSYNAIHGKKAKWSIRAIPQSGGCVRNTNDHAKWVYSNCAKGTTVILF